MTLSLRQARRLKDKTQKEMARMLNGINLSDTIIKGDRRDITALSLEESVTS